MHLKPCSLADWCQMLGDLCCWHRQDTSGSVPNTAATDSSESLEPTYQTTRCHTPEYPIKSERSTGFSNVLCLILRPLLAFALIWCGYRRTFDGPNSGELSGMTTIEPPYQANGGIYFLYQTRHRKLLLLCVIYSLYRPR